MGTEGLIPATPEVQSQLLFDPGMSGFYLCINDTNSPGSGVGVGASRDRAGGQSAPGEAAAGAGGPAPGLEPGSGPALGPEDAGRRLRCSPACARAAQLTLDADPLLGV